MVFNYIDIDIPRVANTLGVRSSNVLLLRPDVLTPDHLDFMGLIREAYHHKSVPDAVIMHNNQPFAYILDAKRADIVFEKQIHEIARLLALRADAPYLVLVRPGIVQVYSLNNLSTRRKPVIEAEDLNPALLAKLTTGMFSSDIKNRGRDVHDLMLSLLNSVTEHLIRIRGLKSSEALALVGRALFMRFLNDRGILRNEEAILGVDEIKNCFMTPEAASKTSKWLDETFNGDLLELPEKGNLEYFKILDQSDNGSALHDLTAIMNGDKPLGDGAIQLKLRWDDLHFAYIPVGLLSQVYEAFAHRFDSTEAKTRSVYYTPRHVAEQMVDRAFSMLGEKAPRARILDPASGGGVFLLAAFRRLIKANYPSNSSGKNIHTSLIRNILNNQIVGMDVNPAARQLTALALYLTALELDPNTKSLKNLTFSPLQGRVLLDALSFESQDPKLNEKGLGSLSMASLDEYSEQFDLVIGNPPWTAVSNSSFKNALNLVSKKCQEEKGLSPAVTNPDGVPDLPFVWAATKWAKPGAVIAFALHGRLLSKMSKAGHASRTQLFSGIDVDYILNGMELRDTNVWPNISAPFCLLFAHNCPTDSSGSFSTVTPKLDEQLNREGRIRIDSKDAWTSDASMVKKCSWLFKALAKGNALDVELLERITELGYPALVDSMPEINASHGYQTLQLDHPGMSPDFLRRLPEMPKPPDAAWWLVPTSKLPKFSERLVHRRRESGIYRAPISLLRESPSSQPGRPLSMLALEDVAYSRSYIGFSCSDLKEPRPSAVYLTTIFNSPLFLYFILMTSSKLGVERSTLQKNEAELFPVPPLNQLNSTQRKKLAKIEESIENSPQDLESLSLDFIRDLYKLRPADIRLIRDRIEYGMPFKTIKTEALRPPTENQVLEFCDTVEAHLNPFNLNSERITVLPQPSFSKLPWGVISIGSTHKANLPTDEHILMSISLGDMFDASLIEIPHENCLYIGILNQRRFWSSTSARTLALDLVRRSHQIISRENT